MDVEASGECPLHGDMISFAAVVIEPGLTRTFDSGNMRPECEKFNPGAYKAIGMTREQHLAAPCSIEERIFAFRDWINPIIAAEKVRRDLRAAETGGNPDQKVRAVMTTDNPGFDFMWMQFEMMNKLGYGLLGHSARRIGDMWSGLRQRPRETQGWKKFRVAPHDHTPLNDCMGNAEAVLTIWEKYGDPKKPFA